MVLQPVRRQALYQLQRIVGLRRAPEILTDGTERLARLGLGDDVQLAAMRELQRAQAKQLQVSAETTGWAPHALRDGAQLAVVWRVQGEDPIRLA